MAKIIVESAFVEEVLIGNTGAWGLKTSEPHSRKNDQDKWETVGRTYRTVKVSRASGIQLEQFTKGDRIQFEGREVTESKKSADGAKTFYDLVVWADSITPAGSVTTAGSHTAPVQPYVGNPALETPPEDPWTSTGSAWPAADIPDESVPF